VENIEFLVDFAAINSKKLQKLNLEGKNSWTFNVFTLGANGTCYIYKS